MVLVAAVACSESAQSTPAPTPTTTATTTTTVALPEGPGAALFANPIRDWPSCASCHVMDRDIRTVGPSLFEMARAADRRVPGLDAETYLRESLVEPDAFVLDGFRAGEMPAGDLTEQEIEDLVTFMLDVRAMLEN